MPTDNAILADHGPLSTDEQRALAQYEGTIERGLGTFLEVGRALAAIHRERLYRTFADGTFDTYCRQRWDFTRQHGHRQMNAARVAALLPSTAPQPTAEAQLRPLSELPEDEVPVVWSTAVEWSKGKTPTASTVKQVVKQQTTPAVHVDAKGNVKQDRPAPTPAEPPPAGPLVNDKKWPKFPGFSLYRENGQPFIQYLPLSKGDAAFADLNRAVAVMHHLGFFDTPRSREETRAELHRLFDASWTPDPRLWTALGNAACLKTITAPKPMRYQSTSVAPAREEASKRRGRADWSNWNYESQTAWFPLIAEGFFDQPRRAADVLAALNKQFGKKHRTLADVQASLRNMGPSWLMKTGKGWVAKKAA